jgi:hypothetical protein
MRFPVLSEDDLRTFSTDVIVTKGRRPWCLEDILPSCKARWSGVDEFVRIVRASWYGWSLLRVVYADAADREQEEYLGRATESSLEIIEQGPFVYSVGAHPSGVPRLFEERDQLFRTFTALRAKGHLRAMVGAYVEEIAWRLSPPRAPTPEIHWELLETTDSIDESLLRFEQDDATQRLKIAVILDPACDAEVSKVFDRKAQPNTVNLRIHPSDLMLADRFRHTVVRIARALDRLPGSDPRHCLEFVDIDLEPEQPCWRVAQDVPYGYSGLGCEDLVDPVFVLDLFNAGTREIRIYSAYIHTRLRHIKPHGIAEARLLRSVATVDLPLNGGTQKYTEVRIPEPVLVPPDGHARLRVRLLDSGYCWRGVVDVGLRYGDGAILRVPALSIFL